MVIAAPRLRWVVARLRLHRGERAGWPLSKRSELLILCARIGFNP